MRRLQRLTPMPLVLLFLAACDTPDTTPVLAGVVSSGMLAAATDEDPRLRRVATEGMDYASVSPDGRLITFVDWTTGDVAVHDLEQNANRLVTNKGSWTDNGSWAEYPVFSSDGRQIAFAYGNTQANHRPFLYEVRVANLDGTGERVVFRYPTSDGWAGPMDWSARHGILLEYFDDAGTAATLALMSPGDGTLRRLKSFPESGPHPHEGRFSPDDRWIAYRIGTRLAVIGSDGSGDQTFEFPIRSILDWTADGSGLIVHATRNNVSGFWRVPMRNGRTAGEPELVRAGVPVAAGAGRAAGRYFYQINVDVPKLHVASVDLASGNILSPPTAVTGPADGGISNSAWSPDGRWLAYTARDADQRFKLMMRSADGDQVMELTDIGQVRNVHNLGWTRDGAALLLTTGYSNQPEAVHRIDARTGAMTKVLQLEDAQNLQLTPGGESVVFGREASDDRDRPAGIVVRNIASGAERLIYTRASRSMSVSPDGRFVAAAVGDDEQQVSRLVVVPIEGGEARVLDEATAPEHIDYNAAALPWTADGRYILSVRGGWQETPHYLFAYPVDGGARVQLFRTKGSGIYQSVHPDNQRVAFIDGERRSELWVLEDLPAR